MALITYDDKVTMNENASVPTINKVRATDMNEIKNVVNKNARRDVITIKLTSDYTISANNKTEKVTGFEVYDQVGQYLSFSNNSIVVGSNVSHVLVSYSARTKSKTNSTNRNITYLNCSDNTDNLSYDVISQEIHNYTTNSQGDVCQRSCSPMIVPVVPGAKFYLTCYGEAGAKVIGFSPKLGSFNTTFITVEAVIYND